MTPFSFFRTGTALVCLLLLLVLPQQPQAAEALVLRNATVHRVSAPPLGQADVLIEDGVIQAVGRDLKAKGRSVDLTGKHLYPGLIASTTTLGLVEVNAVRATRDYREVGGYTPEVQSWTSVNPDSELLPVARANGLTHFLPVPSGGVIPGTSGLMRTAGWTVEDLAVLPQAALHLNWPSMRINTRPKSSYSNPSDYKTPEKQAEARKEKIEELDRFLDDARAYQKARQAIREGKSALPLNPAWEAMLPVLRGERPLIIQADDLRQIRAAREWAAKQKLRWILAGGRDAWRDAEALAKDQVPVIFEHVFTLPAREIDSPDVHFEAPGVLHRAGVSLILSLGQGSFESSNVRNLPYAAAQAVAHGLPAEVALRSMTLTPVEALGLGTTLGSIEPGKEASLVAASGDLLDIRSRILNVWIRGEAVSLESRHTRLYEKYRNRPKPND